MFHRLITDEDGPRVADEFYHHLYQTDEYNANYIPDITQSARALHLAIKKLRDQKRSFMCWVPFIHLGL
jgi:hypothetical protein